MISRSEYSGRIPYEDYVRRFELQEKAHKSLLEKTESFTKQTDTDDTPIENANKEKKALQEIAKKKMTDAIKKQTGIDTDELSKAYNSAFHNDKEPTDDKSKRTKKDITSGILLARATKPSLDNLPADAVERAKFSNASKLAYLNDDEFKTAQEYLNKNLTDGSVIDTELSDSSGIVIRRPSTTGDTVEIHYRGTALTNKPNPDDLHTDARIASGTETDNIAGLPVGKPSQISQAETQFEAVRAKYGNVDHVGGYSRGGGMAIGIGNKYNVPSTTFNPLVGPRHLVGNNSESIQQIYRTTEDPVSLGLAFANKSNLKVDSVKPLQVYQKNILSFNPKNLVRHITNVYDSHRIENFLSSGSRKVGEAELDTLHNELMNNIGKIHQAPQLIDISNSVKNNESYTEMLRKGTHTNDIIETPKGFRLKGNRHNANSNLIQSWIEAGGKFTNGEAKHIADTVEGKTDENSISKENSDLTKRNRKRRPIGEEQQERLNNSLEGSEDIQNKLSPEEKEIFTGNDTEAQKAKLLEYKDNAKNISLTMEESGLDGLSREGNSLQEFSRGMNLSNLALGALIGKGSSEAFNLIPGYKNIGEAKKTAIEGATAGAGQALAQEALGAKKILGGTIAGLVGEGSISAVGYAALAPEIAGGIAGAEAGQYASKYTAEGIQKLGGGKDIQEAGADIVGGGVGGAAAGLTSALVAVGSDVLFGTELGATFGPGGALVGAGLGAGIGTLLFAGSELKGGLEKFGKAVYDFF